MNKPTTEELLHQILSTCLLINAQGKWHAFFDVSGHTGTLSMRMYPSTCTYVAGDARSTEDRHIQFTSSNRHQLLCTEEEARLQMVSALAWVQSYLSTESAA